MDDCYARFNPNPTKIAAWAGLLMLGTSPNAELLGPDVLYNRAIPILVDFKDDLVHLGWHDMPKEQLPPGILFMVERPTRRRDSSPSTSPFIPDEEPPFFNSKTPPSDDRRSAADALERVILVLPSDLSAFLEYGDEIQEIFHQVFKPALDDRGLPALMTSDGPDPLAAPCLNNIFHLLQLIVPGMFLLVHDSLSFSQKPFPLSSPPTANQRREQSSDLSQGGQDSTASRESTKLSLRRTRRALPPAEWIEKKMTTLEQVFGKHLLHDLLDCARDVELTVWTTFHGPDGDQLETGSDAGFDTLNPLDAIWSPETLDGQVPAATNAPNKLSAITPGVGGHRSAHRVRLARSL